MHPCGGLINIFFVAGEHEELFEDDLEPDSQIFTKNLLPQKQLASNGSHDPSMTKLALKIQEAGDALFEDYGGRVEVRFVGMWRRIFKGLPYQFIKVKQDWAIVIEVA